MLIFLKFSDIYRYNISLYLLTMFISVARSISVPVFSNFSLQKQGLN